MTTTPVIPAAFCNIYGQTESPSCTFTAPGTYTYTVIDMVSGNVVYSGNVTGSSLTLPPPGGKWRLGSYRVTGLPSGWGFTIIDKTDGRFPAPPTTTTPYFVNSVHSDSRGQDNPIINGIFGMGPTKVSIVDPQNLHNPGTTLTGSIDRALADSAYAVTWWANNADSTHPRYLLCEFPNGFRAGSGTSSTGPPWDFLKLTDGTANPLWALPNPNHAANADLITVAVSNSAGSVTFTVKYNGTVMETLGPFTNAQQAEDNTHNTSYVWLFNNSQGTFANLVNTGDVAIGNAAYTGTVSAVSQLYTNGVTHFEAINEPQGTEPWQVFMFYSLFKTAVKAGNVNAQVVGPLAVTFNNSTNTWLDSYWNGANGKSLHDAFSTHYYNSSSLGDLKLARACFSLVNTTLGAYAGKRFFTEGWTQYVTSIYGAPTDLTATTGGVGMARYQVAAFMMMLLLAEQYQFDPERVIYYYFMYDDYQPSGIIGGNGVDNMTALPPAWRTLTGERWNKTYTSAVDFGSPGNDLYVGNIYTDGSGNRSWALVNAGLGDGGKLRFNVSGASSLTVVDWAGNTATVPVTNGVLQVAVTNTPVYIRVPAGVTMTVQQLNFGTDYATAGTVAVTGGTRSAPASRIITPPSAVWSPYYNNAAGMANTNAPWQATSTAAQTVTVTLPSQQTVNTALIVAAPMYQNQTTLLDFTVDVSLDGSTFTTVGTYTINPSDYYRAMTTGDYPAFYDCWFDYRFAWLFQFDPANAKAVRLSINKASNGGSLDNTLTAINAFTSYVAAQNTNYPTLQRVSLYNTSSKYVPDAPSKLMRVGWNS